MFIYLPELYSHMTNNSLKLTAKDFYETRRVTVIGFLLFSLAHFSLRNITQIYKLYTKGFSLLLLFKLIIRVHFCSCRWLPFVLQQWFGCRESYLCVFKCVLNVWCLNCGALETSFDRFLYFLKNVHWKCSRESVHAAYMLSKFIFWLMTF